MRHLLTLRAVGGTLKVKHGIIDNLRPLLEKLLKASPRIHCIIPGTIAPVTNAHGKGVVVRISIPIPNGFKALAMTAGARQELFLVVS